MKTLTEKISDEANSIDYFLDKLIKLLEGQIEMEGQIEKLKEQNETLRNRHDCLIAHFGFLKVMRALDEQDELKLKQKEK